MVAVVRLILAALLLEPAVVKAFVTAPMNLLAPSTAPLASRALVSTRGHTQTCICMACRKNMKKDKRLRNRANAFRFKKASTGFSRFNNFADRNAQKEKETEDGEWISLVFSHSAAAAAAEQPEEAAAAQK